MHSEIRFCSWAKYQKWEERSHFFCEILTSALDVESAFTITELNREFRLFQNGAQTTESEQRHTWTKAHMHTYTYIDANIIFLFEQFKPHFFLVLFNFWNSLCNEIVLKRRDHGNINTTDTHTVETMHGVCTMETKMKNRNVVILFCCAASSSFSFSSLRLILLRLTHKGHTI